MGERRHLGGINRLDRHFFGFMIGLADFSRRRAWWVILAAALLSAVSLYYTVTHFAISTDMSKMLSKDLPFEKSQQQFDTAFPGLNKTLLVVVHSSSATLARESAGRLAVWLRRNGQGITYVNQPGGGPFFAREGLLYLSEAQLWQLSDSLSRAQPFIATLAAHPTLPRFTHLLNLALQRAMKPGQKVPGLAMVLQGFRKTLIGQEHGRYAAMPWGTLMMGSAAPESAPGDSFVVVKPRYNYQSGAPVQTAINSVRRGVQALHLTQAHGVAVHITGAAALDNEQVRTVSKSAGLATSLSIVLVLAMLIIGLHRARYVLIILATLFAGLSWTAAFALLATGPLNLISIAFAVLFVGLAVDFGIQFCVRYQEEGAYGDNAQALRATARRAGSALSLAAVAAAISFYSFVPTSYAGIVDLGIISGTGMFIALFANLTLTPALLTVFIKGHAGGRRRGFLRPLLAHLPVHRHPRTIVGVAILIAILLIPMILASRFDFDPMHLQNPHSEAVATFETLLKSSRVSPYPIDILAPNLRSARKTAARLQPLKTVGRVLTAASFVPTNQQAKLAVIAQMALIVPPFSIRSDRAQATSGPRVKHALLRLQAALATFEVGHRDGPLAEEARRLAAAIPPYLRRFGNDPQALLTLERRIIGTLPWQLGELRTALNAGPVSLRTLPASLRGQFINGNGEARIQVFSSLNLNNNANIVRFAHDVTSVAPHAVGPPILLVQGGRAVVDAFREATLISFVLITLVLLVTLRNIADAVTILIPLALAAVVAVAVMWMLGISFNLANIIVLPLLIGLSVAFSIYLVARWREGEGMAHLLDTSTSEAVVFSALTTMSSFGSLAVSSDPGMAVLGKTLLIAMGAALVTILLVLPALLTLRSPTGTRDA
ncbi:MAG TPA: MMPL family transporter [Acidiferrobacter sp.]|nr:MMPL family transporter [Acidiferrobacter sp.]